MKQYAIASPTWQMLTILITVAGLTGCGSPVKTGSVEGVVMLRGKPVVATVAIISEDARSQFMATTDSSGSFVVADAVPEGEYKVAVMPPVGAPPEEASQQKPATISKIWSDGSVPPHYLSHESSGIQAVVKEGTNRIEVLIQ